MAERKLRVRWHEHQRMLPKRSSHRTALSFLPILHADLAAVLSGTHPEAERIPVVKLHPIGPAVHVTGLRIAIDQPAAGPEIASAIVFMEAQSRKLEQIDIIPLKNVFEEWR